MNSVEKQIEAGKEIIRKEGITFNLFKAVVSVLLVKPKFNNDFWVWLYECFAEGRSSYEESIEDWASEHFADFTLENNGTELRQKCWIDAARYKPSENVGVLVFIPEEDDHVTSGMWDVSGKWVLLDENRKPDCAVTHWMELPALPSGKKAKSPNANPDSTQDLLADIISWEKDLSVYESLESILRSRYKISKRTNH